MKAIKPELEGSFFESLEAGWHFSHSRVCLVFYFSIGVVSLWLAAVFLFNFVREAFQLASGASPGGETLEWLFLGPPTFVLFGYFSWVCLIWLRPILLGEIFANSEMIEIRLRGKKPIRFAWGEIERVYTSPSTGLCHISSATDKIVLETQFKGFLALRSAMEFAAEANKQSSLNEFTLEKLLELVSDSPLEFGSRKPFDKIGVMFAALAFVLSPFVLFLGLNLEIEMGVLARTVTLATGAVFLCLLPIGLFQLSRTHYFGLSTDGLSLRVVNRFARSEPIASLIEWNEIKGLMYSKLADSCGIGFKDDTRPPVFLRENILGFYPVILLAEALFLKDES